MDDLTQYTKRDLNSNINQNPVHGSNLQAGSLEELKGFVTQFAMFLPEDKRNAILHTITQLEASGGIQSDEQGQRILQELLSNLGMNH